jgi:hypothetical protein
MASNAMLAVPAKRATSFVDLKGPIAKYMASNFSRQIADKALPRLEQAQLLRNKAAEMADGADQLKEAFIGYFRFLTALENTIPVGKERGGAALRFQWTDAFQPDRGDGRSDVAFEKAALIFNLGAISSQVAMGADLASETGVKNAARSYQEAAGAFAYLAEQLAPRLAAPQPVDLSPDCCGMLSTLCLAQAQECFYTKAAADRKSPALLARIARQVAEYYGGITGLQLPPQLQRELGKPMAAHLGIKAGLYAAYTLLHQAAVFIADDECGQQIACLQEAQRVLEAARREGTGWVKVDRELVAKVDAALKDAGAALQKAERENSSLYFQRVPKAADLAPPAPAALVQPLPPPGDLEAVDPKWFGFLEDAPSAPVSQGQDLWRGSPEPSRASPYASEPVERQPQAEAGRSGGGAGGTLGRFAFGAAKGVAGWAFNQAVGSITDAGTRQAGRDAQSRDIAAMYEGPQTISIGDLFGGGGGGGAAPYSRRDAGGEQQIDSRKYIERVRGLINESIDAIAATDNERRNVLQRWRLPEALGDLGSAAASKLPRDVQRQVDAHRKAGGVQHLVELLREISAMRANIVHDIEKVEGQLDAEAREDEEARQHYGEREWPLQPASVCTANLRDRIAGYKQNLVEADASDRKLEKLVDDNATAFAALGLGTLPGRDSGKQGWFGGESDAVAATAGVRSDLAAVEAAAEERRKLHDAFKRQWNEDDIIQRGGSRPQWQLDQGYRKFQDLTDALERNAQAQKQALQRLEDDMQRYGDLLASRAQRSQAEDAAKTVKRFGNVEQSLRGGMQFYADLQGYVDSLKSETNDYLEERYREGRDAVSLLERVRSGGSAADGGGKQRQQHSSSGGGILGSIFGGRKQETRWYAEPQLPARGARLLPPPPQRTLRLGRLRAAKPLRPSCRGAQMLAARAGPASVCMRP